MSSDADPVLGPVLRQQPLPEWSVLAAALAFWRLQVQQGICTSRWAPYVETLPSDVNCVLQWAPGEVSHRLSRQASSLLAVPLYDFLWAASTQLPVPVDTVLLVRERRFEHS